MSVFPSLVRSLATSTAATSRSTGGLAVLAAAALLIGVGAQPVPEFQVPAATQVSAERAPSQGVLQVRHDDATWELPLIDTQVDAEIAGFVVDVEVQQVFGNPFDEPIEATYLFPLPDNSAVNDMVMQIGERRIVGEIHRRAEAREIYEQARNSGRTAALLDQERPNMFTQHVANILPGEQIEITIHFVQTLNYEDGGYEWSFPTVVGPRYIPAEGTGASKPRDDAHRLDAPYAAATTGHKIAVQVSLDAGVPIQDLRSPSHKLLVQHENESNATISLDPEDRIPNKDFVLRYDVAGDAPDAALLTHRSGLGGYFLLMIQPQSEDALSDATVTPKEMVFVVDTSCSMSGYPLDKAKDVMRLAISEMNPDDRFTVLNFSEKVSALSPLPLPNTSYNRRTGTRFVNSFRGAGGTEMLSGIKAALDLPADDELLRTVLFLTDGYIGNEEAILNAIQQRLGRSRLYSLGVGSSVNRYLLDRMAKMGRGHVQYLRPDEDASDTIEGFYERIRNPVLTDIEVEWQGVEVESVMPDPVPDLFTGQPVILVGRYDKPGRGSVTIRGRVRGKEVSQTIPVLLPRKQDDHGALASLWARTVIEDLESRQYGRSSKALEDEITELALEYRLMSRYTSFVAVEEQVRNDGDGPPKTVRVPLEGPEFVDMERTLGAQNQLQVGSARSGAGGFGRGASSRGSAQYRQRSPRSPARKTQSTSKLHRVETEVSADASPSDEMPQAVLKPDTGASAESRAARPGSSVAVTAEEHWPGLDQRRVLQQLQLLLLPFEKAWKNDTARYPNGGEWRLRLYVDASGRVQRIDVNRDSLRHSDLRKLLQSAEGAWTLGAAGTGRAVELEIVVKFTSEP